MDASGGNYDEDIAFCKIPLKEKLDLQSVLTGAKFDIDIDFIRKYASKRDDDRFEDKPYIPFPIKDEDDDDSVVDGKSPFEKLSERMTDVTKDGKIKKMVLRSGKGQMPTAESFVNIFYFIYLEYLDEPSDQFYARRQFRFQLGESTIPGLSIAVATMSIYEKSLFLMSHEYAFGKMGHPPRIPPEASVLFHIELVTFTEAPLAGDMREERRGIDEAEQRARDLIDSAKKVFNRDVMVAIREYRRAVRVLEDCQLRDMAEEERQVALLVKLYTNLAVCYTRTERPKLACTMCNNVYAMRRNTALAVPPKLYFHNGRAHLMLGNLQKARHLLMRAHQLLPHDPVILAELHKLDAIN